MLLCIHHSTSFFFGNLGFKKKFVSTLRTPQSNSYSGNVNFLFPFKERFSFTGPFQALCLCGPGRIPFSSRYFLIFIQLPTYHLRFRFIRSKFIIYRNIRNVNMFFRDFRNLFIYKIEILCYYSTIRRTHYGLNLWRENQRSTQSQAFYSKATCRKDRGKT